MVIEDVQTLADPSNAEEEQDDKGRPKQDQTVVDCPSPEKQQDCTKSRLWCPCGMQLSRSLR